MDEEILDDGGVYIDSLDIKPHLEQPMDRCAAITTTFHCDKPDPPKPRKGKRFYQLPTLSSNDNEEDFDWAAPTEGAQKMLDSLTIMSLGREIKQKFESDILMLTNGPETSSSTLPEQSSNGTANNGDRKSGMQQLLMDAKASSKPSFSNEHAFKISVKGTKETEFEWLIAPLRLACHFHLKNCFFCATNEHNMVNCPETSSFKRDRIKNLSLCGVCLNPGHLEDACALRESIICFACAKNHLSYVYH